MSKDNDDALLSALEQQIYADPETGLALLRENARDSRRWWCAFGVAHRLTGKSTAALDAFGHALACPNGSCYDLANALRSVALLHLQEHRWSSAFRYAEQALGLHRSAPGGRLADGPEHGLAEVLLTCGTVHYYAGSQGQPQADLIAARDHFHEALAEVSGHKNAPRIQIAAAHNLALLALETGTGLTSAAAAFARTSRALRELGVPATAPPSLRIKWASLVVDWQLGGSSLEVGRRFTRRIENGLRAVFNAFLRRDAYHEALMVALDLGLLYLEARRITKTGGRFSSAGTEPAPRWDDLKELTLLAYEIDWSADHELSAAVLYWRQASLEESLPADALAFIYGKVRGLLKPNPLVHAHGSRWGGAHSALADLRSQEFEIRPKPGCSMPV